MGAPTIADSGPQTPAYLAADIGGRQYARVSLSSADILKLNSSPKVLIPAPGAGKAINVTQVTLLYFFGTVAYATDSSCFYGFTGATTGNAIGSFGNILNQTASQIANALNAQENEQYYAFTTAANAPIILTADADPTAGDGTVKVIIEYQIVTLS